MAVLGQLGLSVDCRGSESKDYNWALTSGLEIIQLRQWAHLFCYPPCVLKSYAIKLFCQYFADFSCPVTFSQYQ